MVRAEVDAERDRRQVDIMQTTAWIGVGSSLIFTALDTYEHAMSSVPFVLLRLVLVIIFFLSAAGTRRGWLRPSIGAACVTASSLSACVIAYWAGSVAAANLFPLIIAINPVIVPMRPRIAIPILTLAAVCFCTVALLVYPEHAWSTVLITLVGAAFGKLMACLQESHMAQTVARLAAMRAQSVRLTLDGERARLARDLHDHIGARLTAMALRSERDGRRLPEVAQPTMRWMQNSAHLCLEELRDTIWALSASQRNAGELLAVLRRRAEDVATEAGLELRWSATAPSWEGSLSPGIGVAMSAILREALTNVVRHSAASAVDISVSRDDCSLTLEIKDNGRGMLEMSNDGRGISNMRSRAEEQHGVAEIQNGTPSGVRVFARLPLDAESQHRIEL